MQYRELIRIERTVHCWPGSQLKSLHNQTLINGRTICSICEYNKNEPIKSGKHKTKGSKIQSAMGPHFCSMVILYGVFCAFHYFWLAGYVRPFFIDPLNSDGVVVCLLLNNSRKKCGCCCNTCGINIPHPQSAPAVDAPCNAELKRAYIHIVIFVFIPGNMEEKKYMPETGIAGQPRNADSKFDIKDSSMCKLLCNHPSIRNMVGRGCNIICELKQCNHNPSTEVIISIFTY